MALAWLFTLPVAAVVGGLSAKVAVSGNAGVALVSFVALGLMAAIYAYSRRAPVNADNVNETAAVSLAPAPVLVAAA
jgi:PiT family inorganic phosphate transporter